VQVKEQTGKISTHQGNSANSELPWGVLRIDDTMAPMAGVKIALYDDKDGSSEPVATASTDAKGRFAFKREKESNGTNTSARIVATDARGRVLHGIKLARSALAKGGRAIDIGVSSKEAEVIKPRGVALRRTIALGPFRVDQALYESMTYEDLLDIARLTAGLPVSAAKRKRVSDLCPKMLPDYLAAKHLSTTELVLALYEIARRKGWDNSNYAGQDIDAILTSFVDSGFAEETYDTANFSITYQTTGSQAIDTDKSTFDIVDPGSNPPNVLHTIAAGGATDPPTYIRILEYWLERALNSYINAPFSLLNPAAGGRIPVYVNHSSAGSASPSGYFSIHWALSPELVCAVTVHELFHMVQFEYGLSYSDPWRQSMMEGGAVVAEDAAADAMNRYIYEASSPTWSGEGLLVNPNRSLISASYDSAIFFRYIAEQQSYDTIEPFVGVETYRKLIEVCSADGSTTAAIRKGVNQLPNYEHLDRYGFLDAARQDRTSSETILGNFALALYLKDLGTNVPDSRFEFLEDEENVGFDEALATQFPGNGPLGTLGSVELTGSDTLTTTAGLTWSNSVNPFASRYYEVNVDSAVDNIDIDFQVTSGLSGGLCQIALIDEDGLVRDIHRSDTPGYLKRLTSERDGKRLDRLAIVVTGAETSGNFTLNVDSAAATSDVMVTRWNSVIGREYEIRSRYWTWVSPDIWVDNDGNGLADSVVWFNYDNKLTIRLRNKGNAEASNIRVDFWYQDASGGLSDAAWTPVRDRNGNLQALTGLNLSAGDSDTFQVDWSPTPSGGSNHFCVRAVVTSPDCTNTDNKRVLSNFGNVKVRLFDRFDLLLVLERLRHWPEPLVSRVVSRIPPALATELKVEAPHKLTHELEHDELKVSRVRMSLKPVSKRHTSRSLPSREKLMETRSRMSKVIQQHQQGNYPPADALPPGVYGQPLVTVAVTADGEPVGGFTAALWVDDEKVVDK
jgi:5-hydroxyisourate hydrolase-like protein (transthyretin family)